MKAKKMKTRIFDIPISNLNEEELIDGVIKLLHSEDKSLVCYSNIHTLNLAYVDTYFKKILRSSKINLVDGYGVKYLSNLILCNKIKSALTPPSWINKFYSKLQPKTKIFFIGDEDFIIEKYFNMIKNKFVDLNFVGYNNGFFENSDEIIQKINKSKPDILILGMGQPYQEKWVYENIDKINSKIFFVVGALFRWEIGYQKRPPNFISKLGLEWFYRFILEPKRLFKRYIIGNPLFLYRLIKYKLMS